jgi:RimJ/RimL family protein N-acetyltransferase
MITESADEQFLDFKCPYCGEMNSFPQDCSGHVRECVNCMESLIVPGTGNPSGKKIPLPITTPQLVLRRLDAGDWKDLLGFMFDDEEEATRWLENDRKVKLTTADQTFTLGIQVRNSGKIIGCVGLKFTDFEFLEAMISADSSSNDQYKDFVREAIAAVLGFYFKDLRLHRVIARTGGTDDKDCQLFEAVGMRREGEFVKSYRAAGKWLNTIWFAMLDEEYPRTGS